MKIGVIGCGYVGSVTGAGFAELGHDVLLVDIDREKVKLLNAAQAPVYEPGLEELIARNKVRLHATATIEKLADRDLSFICVGTPSHEDGSIDLTYIRSAAEDLGGVLAQTATYQLVVVKSTVVPGTTEHVVKPAIEAAAHKTAGSEFGLAMNPEFLREGSAVKDFFEPDRIVFGTEDERSRRILAELYRPFHCEKVSTTIKTAEMIKYVSNAFLATKISFANEVGNLCKRSGIDVYEVFRGVGLDRRINPAFFRVGIGFGGSCFPKDVKALIAEAAAWGDDPRILRAVIQVNEAQPLKLLELLKRHISDLRGRRIGLLGLAFKPDTDDIRESRAVPVVERLLAEGAVVVAYDPQAMAAFAKRFPQITYASSAEVLKSDAVLIITEWPEFEQLDYTGKLVIDGRRIATAQKEAAVYEGVCW
jgi:UDPglucose 6-dehydrogenase